jgi:hypothetical protein
MPGENKNLENPYSKKRKILKWIFIGLGVFFIVIGVLAPIILFIMAGGQGWWLPVIFGVAFDYSPAFIFLGIILILIGSIFQKASLIKKILLILLIISSIPNIFKATIGTFIGYRWEKNILFITGEGITEVSKEKLTAIINKASSEENAAECKKLLPFPSFPSSAASRLLPEFFNPYIYPSGSALTAIFPFIPSQGTACGSLCYILRDPFAECVAEVAKKKKDPQLCKNFYGYPINEGHCLYLVSQELIKEYEDSKYCDLLKGAGEPPCAIQECLLGIAIKKKDFELCKRLKVEEGGWCPRREDYYKECTDELSKISPELITEYIWNTYKNEEYEYKINYPDSWSLGGNTGSYCPGVSKQCYTRFFTIQGEESPKIYIYNPSPDAITIKKYNPFASKAPNIFEIEKDMKLIKTEKEMIKDSEYYFEKFFYVPQEGVEKESIILVKWVAGSFENSGAIVIYYKDETDKNLKIFNQMLSTLRFIKDETADWKTYTNEEYRFEMKYPKDWLVQDSVFIDPVNRQDFINKGIEPLTGAKFTSLDDPTLTVSLIVHNNYNNDTLEEWLKVYQETSPTGASLSWKEEFSIAGEKGLKGGFGCCMTYRQSAFLTKGNRVYQLEGGLRDLQAGTYENDAIFNQMLSTFRFIE